MNTNWNVFHQLFSNIPSRVYFSVDNQKTKESLTEKTPDTEAGALAESEKKRNEIANALTAVENGENNAEQLIQELKERYGEDSIREAIKERTALSKDAKTKVLGILGDAEEKQSKKDALKKIITEKRIRDERELSDQDRSLLLSASPIEMIQLLKDDQVDKSILEKDAQWYIQIFLANIKNFSAEDKDVQAWIEEMFDEHKEETLEKLPNALQEEVKTLQLQILQAKGKASVEDIRELTHIQESNIIAKKTLQNAPLSQNKEENLYKSIVQIYNNDKLNTELKTILKRNEQQEKLSKVAEMIEVVQQYLLQKISNDQEMSLKKVQEIKKEHDVFHESIFKIARNNLSEEQKTNLLHNISIADKEINKILSQFTNPQRSTLNNNPAVQNEIQEAEEILANVYESEPTQPAKSFGVLMAELNSEYTWATEHCQEIKKQYDKKEITIQQAHEKLQEKGIVVAKTPFKSFLKEEIANLEPSHLPNLQSKIPKRFSLEGISPYIKNITLHKTVVSTALLKNILGKKPLPETEEIFSENVTVVQAKKVYDILNSITFNVVKETGSAVEGITTNPEEKSEEPVYREYEKFQDIDRLERIFRDMKHYFQRIETVIEKALANYPQRLQQEKATVQERIKAIPEIPLNKEWFVANKQQVAQMFAEFLKENGNSAVIKDFLTEELKTIDDVVVRPLENQAQLLEKKLKVNPSNLTAEILSSGINIKDIELKESDFAMWQATEMESFHNIPEHNECFYALVHEPGLVETKNANGESFWTMSVAWSKRIQTLASKEPKLILGAMVPHAMYIPSKKQILVPFELYQKIIQYPQEKFTAQESESLWHELSHYFFNEDYSPKHSKEINLPKGVTAIIDVFKQKNNSEYSQLFKEFKKQITNTDALAEEELAVMIMTELQKPKSRRNYKSGELGDIVKKIIEILDPNGEGQIKTLLQKELMEIVERRQKKYPGYFSLSNASLNAYQNQKKYGFQAAGELAEEQTENSRFEEIMLMRKRKHKEYNAQTTKLKEQANALEKNSQKFAPDIQKAILDNLKRCRDIINEGERLILQAPNEHVANKIIIALKDPKFKYQDKEDADSDKPPSEKIDDESVTGKLNTLSTKLTDFPMDDRGYLKQLWDNTEFLAIKDFTILKNTLFSFIKQRWNDQQSLRVHKVGKNLTPSWGFFSGLENQFSNDAEGAHAKVVGNYKTAIKNETNSYVSGTFIPAVKNKEALRAGIEHLCAGGNMKWEKLGPTIQKKLLEYGSGVQFVDSDFKNEMVYRLKFKKAFYKVYGDETLFDKLYNDNISADNAAVDKGQSQRGKLGYGTSQVKEWIRQKCLYPDDPKNFYVKAQILEGYILGELLDGGFNTPQEGIYYMIMAIAQEIIDKKSLARAWAHTKEIPAFQFLFSKMGDAPELMQKWQKEILWDPKNGEFRKPWDDPPEWFDTWLDKTILIEDEGNRTIERSRNRGASGFDHDNTYLNFTTGDASMAISYLADGKNYNGGDQNPTRFQNMPSASMRFFSSLALMRDKENKQYEHLTRKNLIRHAGYYTAMYGMSMLDSSGENGNQVYKFGEVANNKPRGSGQAYNGDMNIKDYFEAQNTFFQSLKNIPGQDEGLIKFIELVYESKSSKNTFGSAWNNLINTEESIDGQTNFKYKALREAIKNTPESEITERNAKFYQNIVPAVLEYFLHKGGREYSAERANNNYETLVENIEKVSTGKGGVKKWKNENEEKILIQYQTEKYNEKYATTNEKKITPKIIPKEVKGKLKWVEEKKDKKK